MAFLNDRDRQQIGQAIAAAEARTSGELVAVVARASDHYLYIPLLWAALIALTFPGPLLLFGNLHVDEVYAIQVIVFLALALVFNLVPLKMRLIPRAVRQARAHRLALAQFVEQNLHATAERSGVLIFVSVAEHHVEILADRGIDARVPADAWERVIAEFTGRLRAGQVAEGFVQAVNTCGELLAEHFPAAPGDRNELPDRLVEL
ncbi:MAG: TPM domain-containing protein [Gammaproteobacteria bacterium]|nr:TPM domain-containing protein [Gammaproteobacteria bacterium]